MEKIKSQEARLIAKDFEENDFEINSELHLNEQGASKIKTLKNKINNNHLANNLNNGQENNKLNEEDKYEITSPEWNKKMVLYTTIEKSELKAYEEEEKKAQIKQYI